MAIFVEDEEPFEAGTTISSRVRITDEDDNITEVDLVNGEEKITLEIIHSNSGEVIYEESTMEGFDDDSGDRFYLDTWTTSEDDELGQYYMIHRAQVGGDPFKMTRIIELRDTVQKK